jgi:hypothetical protein
MPTEARNTTGRCDELALILHVLTMSANVCDRRKVRDLRGLEAFCRGPWRDRFEIVKAGSMPDRSLGMVCALRANGLVWANGAPQAHDIFAFVLGLPPNYPVAIPSVRFLDPVPWSPHVVHADFLPPLNGLPAEFQEYVRQGHGHCCYLRTFQWTPDAATHTLATVAWQISRILTLSKSWAEVNSLNLVARDHALRLAREGAVPLGAPLPCPTAPPDAAAADDEDGEDPDVEWEGSEAAGSRT